MMFVISNVIVGNIRKKKESAGIKSNRKMETHLNTVLSVFFHGDIMEKDEY